MVSSGPPDQTHRLPSKYYEKMLKAGQQSWLSSLRRHNKLSLTLGSLPLEMLVAYTCTIVHVSLFAGLDLHVEVVYCMRVALAITRLQFFLNSCMAPFPSASAELRRYANRLLLHIISPKRA